MAIVQEQEKIWVGDNKTLIIMKGIYSLLLLSVCTLALVSCMEDTEQTYRNNTLKNISVSAEDFEYDGDSRTMFEITENGAEFSWSENDTIGIFPSTGAQAYFPMISGDLSLFHAIPHSSSGSRSGDIFLPDT